MDIGMVMTGGEQTLTAAVSRARSAGIVFPFAQHAIHTKGEITKVELERLREAVATLVLEDPVYVPIFERLDLEISALEMKDPVARARAILVAQKAIA